MRSTTVSRVIPIDPSICRLRSTTLSERLGAEHFGHAGFVTRVLVTIQQPSRLPDCQTRQMQIDFVVGKHETDALMVADYAAERMTPSGIFGGDGVTSPRCAEPAHAMGQARRSESDLCIAETLADLPQHAVGRDT